MCIIIIMNSIIMRIHTYIHVYTLEFLAASWVSIYPGRTVLFFILSRAISIAGIEPDELKPFSPRETMREK